jgi:uncharacterized protein (TIGR00725 family)
MQIAIIGSSNDDDKKALALAYEVGSFMAKEEITLVSGGLSGVMSEASRGAFEHGGDVLAVLPTLDPADANPWVTHVVATGQSYARNLSVVASSDAVIALAGHWGTLSEIAFARKLGLSVVLLANWKISFPDGEDPGLFFATTAREAIALAKRNAKERLRSLLRSKSVDNKINGQSVQDL